MSEKDSQLSFEDVAASAPAEVSEAPAALEVAADAAVSTDSGRVSDEAAVPEASPPVAASDTAEPEEPKAQDEVRDDGAAKPAGIRRELIKPGKIFYKMGDICEITGLEPHVLRFWEAEFEQLQPKKNRSGHRIYTVEDIELVICIRRLLHEEGYTIPGARKKLEDPAYESGENHGKPREMQFILNEISGIRKSLESAIKLLDGP